MANNDNNQYDNGLFKRLTRIFMSGPAIQRRIKGYNYETFYNNKITKNNFGYRMAQGYGRENNTYSSYGFSNQNGFGILDRMARYADFSMMETIPEINSALDLFADESVGGDDRGKSFHVYSKNPQIKKALDELFYDIMNVEYNIRPYVRNLVKYGDFFLFLEVVPNVGIVNVYPLPVNEIEREEGFDEADPYSVRFKWINRGNLELQNWQIAHFRILGNDQFLPYGSSILDSSRRIAHQLMLMEDSMLVYRLVRAPERRVYYVDIGNTEPNDIPSFMEAVKTTLKSNTLMDKQNGRLDQRFNPISITDDIFIPTRGGQTNTKIDTLAAGTNNATVDDVKYLQGKLFSALKVPKAYLNYDESTGAKATLAQEDVRFSRTIAMIQKVIIAELNKIAMVHLYTKGFDGEDLIDYQLKLSNPSTIAIQQRLELWSSKFDVAGTAKETALVDSMWIQKNILELSDDEIVTIEKGLRIDAIRTAEYESIAVAEDATELANRTIGTFNSNPNVPGSSDITKGPLAKPTMADDLAANGNIAITPSGVAVKTKPETTEDILKRVELYGQAVDDGNIPYLSNEGENDKKPPIKANPFLSRNKHNKDRRVGSRGSEYLVQPDFNAMLSPTKNRRNKDVYDSTFLKSVGRLTEEAKRETEINSLLDTLSASREIKGHVTNEIKSAFKNFDKQFNLIQTNDGRKVILTEGFDVEDDDDENNDSEVDFDIIGEEIKEPERSVVDLDELTEDLD